MSDKIINGGDVILVQGAKNLDSAVQIIKESHASVILEIEDIDFVFNRFIDSDENEFSEYLENNNYKLIRQKT